MYPLELELFIVIVDYVQKKKRPHSPLEFGRQVVPNACVVGRRQGKGLGVVVIQTMRDILSVPRHAFAAQLRHHVQRGHGFQIHLIADAECAV